jgi:dipeptidyl aminopeptidase/acylaminoacyl peptidase
MVGLKKCTMALLALKKVTWIKCLVIGAGNYNYLHDKDFRPVIFNMLTKSFNLSINELKKRSALFWVKKIYKIPILILHGTGDWRCSVENSLQLSIEFFKYKIPYKLVIYPGGDHSLSEYKKDVKNEVMLHFKKYLFKNEVIDLTMHGK